MNLKKTWGLLLTCCIGNLVITGIMNNLFQLFVVPISTDLGFSRQLISVMPMVKILTAAASAFVVPKFYHFMKPKMCMLLGTIGTGVFFAAMVVITSPLLFIIVSILQGLFGMMILLPIPILINNVFPKAKGTANGISFGASGVGGAIFSPILTGLIASRGWQNTVLFVAVFSFVISFISILIFIKKGYFETTEDQKAQQAADAQAKAIERQKPKPQGELSFPVFLFIIFVLGFGTNAFNTHAAALFQEAGIALAIMASIVSITMLVLTFAKIGVGVLFDLLGTKRTYLISVVILLINAAAMAFCFNGTSGYIAGITWGLSAGIATVGTPILALRVKGDLPFEKLWSRAISIQYIGSALGAWIPGLIYDLANYTVAFVLIGVLYLAAGAILLKSLKSDKKYKAELATK